MTHHNRSAPEEYPKQIREMWAAFNAYRKLGFSADDIFFAPVDDRMGVVVEKGELHHGINCGRAYEGWQEDCLAFFEDIKEGLDGRKPGFNREALDKIYEDSAVFGGAEALVTTLLGKGITPPKLLD